MVVTYFVHASSSANLANAKVLLQYSIIRIYDEFFYGSILIHSFFGVPFIVHSTRSLSRQMQAKNKHAHTPPKSVCNEQTGTQAVRTRAFGSILNPPVLAFILWVEYILTNSDSHSHIQRMPLWKLGADRSLLSRAWLKRVWVNDWMKEKVIWSASESAECANPKAKPFQFGHGRWHAYMYCLSEIWLDHGVSSTCQLMQSLCHGGMRS